MKYICAQPGTLYYAWQLEVMLMNFKEMGIPLKDVHIVCAFHDPNVLHYYHKLSNEYPDATIEFYPDTRRTKHYPSSIRPNILKQHFFKHKITEPFFYHDCDMIFTRPVDFTPFLQDDVCYGSDTRFYIGHDYIKSKGYNILETMASLSEIDVETIKENELNCIGAQYLIKGVNYAFWSEVENICETLFLNITLQNNQIKTDNPEYHELQIWTADMWAVLWQLWKLGLQTKVDPYFEFAWATSTKEDWERLNIYHNAGITESGHGFFFKGEYQLNPPTNLLEIRPNSAQFNYFEYIKRLKIVI